MDQELYGPCAADNVVSIGFQGYSMPLASTDPVTLNEQQNVHSLLRYGPALSSDFYSHQQLLGR